MIGTVEVIGGWVSNFTPVPGILLDPLTTFCADREVNAEEASIACDTHGRPGAGSEGDKASSETQRTRRAHPLAEVTKTVYGVA